MILAVRANQDSFHTIRFQAGINLILAERTKESTRKDSRNGLGKSTVIEIINFCLGARVTRGQGIVRDDLVDWTFVVDLNLGGTELSLLRSVKDPSEIQVTRGTGPARTTAPMKPEEVNRLLGHLAFGLSDSGTTPAFGCRSFVVGS